MAWLTRLFDPRETVGRIVLLDLFGLGYLILDPTQSGLAVSCLQWTLAVLGFTAAPALYRWPVVSLLAQAGLLAAALVAAGDPMINRVGACWALFELAAWAQRRWLLAGGVGLVVVLHLVDAVIEPDRRASSLLGLGWSVALPVLGGLVLRTTRLLGEQAEQAAILHAEEERHRREQEIEVARATERGAIARDLHDVVAHHVASMVLRVGVARHVLPSLDRQVAEVFDDLHHTGNAALGDLRRLVEVLRDSGTRRVDASLTAIAPSALPAALDGAVEVARRAGLVVEAEITPDVGELDSVRAMAVLRLTQEALTNVAKHAGTAAKARLTVVVTGSGAVEWAVTDDGAGARLDPAPHSGGHGLVGMRERVEVLRGTFTAGPAGDAGWKVRAVLPTPHPVGSAAAPQDVPGVARAAVPPGLPHSAPAPTLPETTSRVQA